MGSIFLQAGKRKIYLAPGNRRSLKFQCRRNALKDMRAGHGGMNWSVENFNK
jgi:hypothetical protein